MLLHPLESAAREAAGAAQPCCYYAIVLLGGGIFPADPPLVPSFHLLEGADRVVHAAELFHKGVAPRIVVSGGQVFRSGATGNTEAQAMRALLTRLSVPSKAIVSEDEARNTLDNIGFVRSLVQDESVALVTSAFHMPRSMRIAQRAGLKASAFPTDWQIPAAARPSWSNWLPTVDAERISALALREYLALALDWRPVPQGPANGPRPRDD